MMPDRGSPEWNLWVAAIEVAISAPMRQGAATPHAKISWKRIHELRTALDAAGIDWRAAKTKQDARLREIRKTGYVTVKGTER